MRFTASYADRHRLRSGVHLGALGTGGVEWLPDGRFTGCSIFGDTFDRPDLDLWFSWEVDGHWRILRLSERLMPGIGSQVPALDAIEVSGNWPCVTMAAPDGSFAVTAQVYSVPGDLASSTLPAIHFTVRCAGRSIMALLPPVEGIVRQRGERISLATAKGEICLDLKGGRVDTTISCVGETLLVGIAKGPAGDWIKPGTPWRNRQHGDRRDERCVLVGTFDGDGDALLTWHFAEARDRLGNDLGRWYAERHCSAEAVANHVRQNQYRLQQATDAFFAAVRSRLPEIVADAVLCQCSALTRQAILRPDGSFAVWEGGDDACGTNTVDVAFYGSWLYTALWPELERIAQRLTVAHQTAEGWVPHMLASDLHHPTDYNRKDMNAQFVLMVVRDWILGGRDAAWRDEMLPAVLKALRLGETWDRDGDGVPEAEGSHAHTFDAWGWKGCSLYLANLWAAAYVAGGELARSAGDHASADWCEQRLTLARAAHDTLWNGRYFMLWKDGADSDEGCLLTGLGGDWYLRLLGLPPVVDQKRVMSHLLACLELNRVDVDHRVHTWTTFPGEIGDAWINGGYADHRRVTGQQYEPWTGMEYAFASQLLAMGLVDEGWRVIAQVQGRKEVGGGAFRHVECGHYYFRPMAIGVLLAVAHGNWKPPVLPRGLPAAVERERAAAIGQVDPAGR